MKDKKKFSVGKAILIAIPVLLIGGAAAVIIPLHQNYQKNAYVPAPVEEAPEEFVNFEIPEYPELSFEVPEDPVTQDPIIVPDVGLGVPGTEIPEAGERDAETEASAETKAETEAKPETEADTETDPETEAKTEEPEADPQAAQQTADPNAGTEQQAQQQQQEQQQSWQPAAEPEQQQTWQEQQTWQPQQQQTPQQTWQPAEATPQTVNTPIQYDTKASFANSNAVSVYGYTPIYKVAQKDPDVENILVLGTDSRDVTMYRGNSDTMIVFSYNKKKGTVKMVTFMRDALVPIAGHDWNRLNSAYPYDGIGLTVNTINQLFGLDIQEFVIIDFNGTKDFISHIGGIDVNLTAEEAAYYGELTGREFTVGVNHLGAADALMHMRNRKIGYDFARTSRQRDVLTAVIRQIMSKPITEIYEILNYSFSLVKTNISLTSLTSLALSVSTQGSNLAISTQQVPYSDAYKNAWYNGLEILSFDIASTATRINQFLYN
ncbi:MAG: LCP family protein [Clostridiales bacterium]|nr:LCP family protein [Clostridiales bacterium]